MKKHLHLILLVLSTLWVAIANAQDPSFSQYYNTPFLTNPAMLSAKPEMAIGVNYRNQWQSIGVPFNTFDLQGYYPILSKDKYRQFGAAGLMVLTDVQPGGFIKSTGVAVAGAYKLPLNYANFLHFGIQFQYYQHTLSNGNLTTGSQWNGANFDPSLSNGESLGLSRGVPSVGLGALYINEDGEGDQRGTFGFSIFNINKPNVSFNSGGVDNLYRRLVVTGSIRAVKVNNLTVIPTFRYQLQGKAYHIQGGSLFRYGINQGRFAKDGIFGAGSVGLGLFYQYENALIVALEFNQPRYAVSISYDFGVSKIKDGSSNSNASEIWITYRKALGHRKKADKRFFKTNEGDLPVSAPQAPVEASPTPVVPPTTTPAVSEPPAPTVAPQVAPVPTPATTVAPAQPATPKVAPAKKPVTKKSSIKGKKGGKNSGKIRTKSNTGRRGARKSKTVRRKK